ncbi:MAG TPA: SagB/ThcOx family dehydrogenase [Blastocatellia bacterium]|nr:SagB/ThcOx family dehydrogenase [Blastocatellia bacterium]
MIPTDDPTTLSLLYHLNSEPWDNAEAYLAAKDYEVEYKEMVVAGDELKLPAPSATPLSRLLEARESCREYRLRRMPAQVLSNILASAYGTTRTQRLDGIGSIYLRAAPSAGGLFPLEIYALAREVEGAADGLYHYNVRRHGLELLKTGAWFEELHHALLMAPLVQGANLILFLSAVFARSQKKYGPRGYRYIMLEAGHVAQNVCLSSVEQGLGSLCMGGYLDGRLNSFLGLDGIQEAVVYSVAVGYSSQIPAR